MDEKLKKDYLNFLIGKKGLRQNTAGVYVSRLKHSLKHLGREFTPEKVSEDELIQYFTELKVDYQMAQNSRRLIMTALKTFYAWFARQQGVPDPTAELKPIRQYYADPRFINPDELEILLRYAADQRKEYLARRDAAVIALLADTGIRIGEFENIRLGDVRPMTRGRDVHNFELTVSATKTSHARTVPFARIVEGDLCAEYFTRYYLWITLEKKQSPERPLFWKTGRLPDQEDMSKAITRRTVRSILARTRRAAGIKPISAHDFRHFYGTYSFLNGMDLHTLQVFMGHSRMSTTARYIHVAERVRGSGLAHSATVGLRAPRQDRGYAALFRLLKNKGGKP